MVFKNRRDAELWIAALNVWMRVDHVSGVLEGRLCRRKEPRLRAAAKVLHEQAERYREGVRAGLAYVARRQDEFVVDWRVG